MGSLGAGLSSAGSSSSSDRRVPGGQRGSGTVFATSVIRAANWSGAGMHLKLQQWWAELLEVQAQMQGFAQIPRPPRWRIRLQAASGLSSGCCTDGMLALSSQGLEVFHRSHVEKDGEHACRQHPGSIQAAALIRFWHCADHGGFGWIPHQTRWRTHACRQFQGSHQAAVHEFAHVNGTCCGSFDPGEDQGMQHRSRSLKMGSRQAARVCLGLATLHPCPVSRLPMLNQAGFGRACLHTDTPHVHTGSYLQVQKQPRTGQWA